MNDSIKDDPIDTSELASGWKDTLIALIEEGPVDDGDTPSKVGRDSLIAGGFAAYVILDQKEAGCCATYYGRVLYCQLMGEDTLDEALAQRQAQMALKRFGKVSR